MYRKLAPHCTINQAESLAISNAIDWISNTNHNRTNHNFRIYTDSSIALQQIAKINTTLPIVKKCLGNLQALKKGNINVYFHWIKGHSGSAGNDRADLARCASAKFNSCTYNKISSKHLNNLIHNIILKTWQVRWDNGSTWRLTHCFFPCPTDSMLHPRYPTFQLTQLLTGHGNLNTYLKRFLNKTDGLCDCGLKEEEDPEHIIFFCPYYSRQRKELIRTIKDNGFHWPCMLKDLISDKKNFSAIKRFATGIRKLD
ncbi:uncharacterized protein LOC111615629 [Centruroides sculpturatus]|uniref:uncharacterized protein LOC111615629 n=1 Tax=Centruroides sculpturatus TaxID=218467 RepID=UPI000C6CA5F6|nr:uncharacterized protein LOC111615629 [Centruroides sculpturatus]